MQTFKCNFCENEYDSYTSISLHYRKSHGITSEVIRKTIYNNGEDPLCKCGCGEIVSWNYGKERFNDFKHGHYVRTVGGFYSPEGAKKSVETRKKRFKSGEIKQWNKGLSFEDTYGIETAKIMRNSLSENKIRSKKISNSLKGKKKSEEHIKKITQNTKMYWSKEENRLAQRDRRMQYIIKNGFQIVSKLEKTFMGILNSIGIEYHTQFYVSEIPALYDFKIKGKNILIEVDGDYWHCKPGTKFEVPQYDSQFSNIKNDKIKTEWAESNGYTLLRFWESDIENDRLQIVKTLIENLT
jgi:G:T-mismatch repair DNA endonuclease (very short patch repair protein)